MKRSKSIAFSTHLAIVFVLGLSCLFYVNTDIVQSQLRPPPCENGSNPEPLDDFRQNPKKYLTIKFQLF